MSKAKTPVSERVTARLELRRSNAAQRHENAHRTRTRPGHGKRSQQKARAIAEYR